MFKGNIKFLEQKIKFKESILKQSFWARNASAEIYNHL